jgi:hypothetical protein
MNKIIYITGSQNSGTTLLNIILGGHSNLVGLGEILQLLKQKKHGLYLSERLEDNCSCGAKVKHCSFWGEVSKRLDSKPVENINQRYNIVREVFLEQFGPDRLIVDSSKSLSYLKNITGEPGINLVPIHLTRDVRAYCISRIDRAIRDNKKRKMHKASTHFRKWYYNNRGISQHLEIGNRPYFRLGYEELSLYPDKLVPALCEWLELSFESGMLNLTPEGCHIVHGNRMRNQPDKNRTIRYDNRWFYRSEWLVPFVLSSKTRKLNNKLVYQNEINQIWKR